MRTQQCDQPLPAGQPKFVLCCWTSYVIEVPPPPKINNAEAASILRIVESGGGY
jgi:hypothetical protein